MDLQGIFHVMAIIFMTLSSIVLIIIAVLLLTLRNKIVDLHELIDKKVHQLSDVVSDPSGLAIALGTKVANSAINKVKDALKK